MPLSPQRHVYSNKKSIVYKLVKSLDTNNKLPTILQKLKGLAQLDQWNTNQHKQFEDLDKVFTEELLLAKHMQTSPHRAVATVAPTQIPHLHTYWKKTIQGLLNKKHVADQLYRIRNQLTDSEHDIFQGDPQRPATYQLRLASSSLQRERREATAKRQQHLTFRLETLVTEGRTTQSKAVANILKAERRHNCFRKFQSYTKVPKTCIGLDT
jgi:hypothetical protein